MKKILIMFSLLATLSASAFEFNTIMPGGEISSQFFNDIFNEIKTELGLSQPKLVEYSELNGDFLITGTSGWNTVFSSLIPYQLENGTWRLKFNIYGTLSPGVSSHFITISGIMFKATPTQPIQSVTIRTESSSWDKARVTGNDGRIHTNSGSVYSHISLSGDIVLESKPSFVPGE